MPDKRIHLPPRVFLYTLDQVATMLEIDLSTLRTRYVYYVGRSVGIRPKGQFLARDISPPDARQPDWRVAEMELKRWMRAMHFRFHTQGWIKD